MSDTIKKVYRYYFYRIYLFCLKNWNNKKSVALVATEISMIVPLMLNFCTIAGLLKKIFDINIIPDYQTYKTEVIVAISILALIYIAFNNKVLIRKFDEIISEFKGDDRKTFNYRGWMVAIYVIGSYFLFGLLIFTGEYW